MAGSAETSGVRGGTSLDWLKIREALRPAPRRFTFTAFAKRACQHLVVYAVILVTALYVCLLVFAPIETSLLSIFCIGAAGLVGLLSSSSRRKFHRLIEGGIAAGYIAGAAALLKAFEAFLHRS
jgi:hypothetical protein